MLTKLTITSYKEHKDNGTYTAYADAMANYGSDVAFLSMVMSDSAAKSFIHDFRNSSFYTRLPDGSISFRKEEVTMESQKVKGGYHHFLLSDRPNWLPSWRGHRDRVGKPHRAHGHSVHP